jgi:hypothetical protein
MASILSIDCSHSRSLQELHVDTASASIFVRYRGKDSRGQRLIHRYADVSDSCIDNFTKNPASFLSIFLDIKRSCQQVDTMTDFPFPVTNHIGNTHASRQEYDENRGPNNSRRRQLPGEKRSSKQKGMTSSKATKEARSSRTPQPKKNFSAQWLSSITSAQDDLPWLELHLDKINFLTSLDGRSCPLMLPPLKDEVKADPDNPADDISSLSSVGKNSRQESGSLISQSFSTNRYAMLSDYEVSESEDEERVDAAKLTKGIAKMTVVKSASPPKNEIGAQNRYIRVKVIVTIVECLRQSANKHGSQRHWRLAAEFWQMAYDQINELTIELKPVYDFSVLVLKNLSSEQLPDGHEQEQLTEVFTSVEILQSDTQSNLERAIRDFTRELEAIQSKLDVLTRSRDEMKRKLGDRWKKGNDKPRSDRAVARLELERESEEIVLSLDMMQLLKVNHHFKST